MDRGTVGYNPWDLKELDRTEYACKYPGQTLRACGQRKVHPGLRSVRVTWVASCGVHLEQEDSAVGSQ